MNVRHFIGDKNENDWILMHSNDTKHMKDVYNIFNKENETG